MKLALAQMQMTPNLDENYQKSLDYLREAKRNGAELICFPEVQLSPFFAQYENRDVTEYLMGLEDDRISEFCAVCGELGIFASPNFYIEDQGKRYDMSLLIDDRGEIIGKQKMVHVAQCEYFYEQDYYTPSEEGFQVFLTRLGRIGIVVCFDRHYPESIRTEALRGADLIIIPTANTTAEPSRLFEWEVRVQAFQNSVNIAMCNRVGVEDRMEFSGESLVSDYNGDCIIIGDNKEGILYAEVDMDSVERTRKMKPYTSLRRPEMYE